MTDLSADIRLGGNARLRQAVHRHSPLSRAGLTERIFTLLFSGLVYPQIWEDPEIDIEAMQLGAGHRVVTISSGGCNALAYLTRQPAHVDAVDLNPSHLALLKLKLAAIGALPAHADFLRFFAEPGNRHNGAAFDRFVAPALDEATRRHWQRRDLLGRRRIAAFERNFYHGGLLGLCIALGHRVARLHGVDPSELVLARSRRDQRAFFEQRLAPLFDRPLIRFVTSSRASLFGLGIPPAQYDALLEAGRSGMAEVLKARLEKLACHFDLADNYFAWQAFARRYPRPEEGALPLYLQAAHFPTIRAAAGRVTTHHLSFTELLAAKPAGSVDRYVLLDAQDWMDDAQLTALWTQITRTAAPGARVVFRTAAEPSLLPGRVPAGILARWRYEAAASRAFTARDRSAIYGGFHLYVRDER